MRVAVNLTNCIITNNNHEDSLMHLIDSNTHIRNTIFMDNLGKSITHGISLSNSNLTAANITVDYTDFDFLE